MFLSSLLLRGNKLTSLPREIRDLAELTFLDVSHNELQMIPDEIGFCSSLTVIKAQGASWLLPLEDVAILGLSRVLSPFLSPTDPHRLRARVAVSSSMYWQWPENRLETVPEALFSLKRLTSLDLSDNQLTQVRIEVFSSLDPVSC